MTAIIEGLTVKLTVSAVIVTQPWVIVLPTNVHQVFGRLAWWSTNPFSDGMATCCILLITADRYVAIKAEWQNKKKHDVIVFFYLILILYK